MSKDNSDSFKLSRRKALASMGAIGAAGALGIGGTYAQFTDTESQQATFSAGGIDGTLTTNASYLGEQLDGSESPAVAELVEYDGETAGASIHFEDVKPGDYGSFNFTLEVQDNPAWVASCLGIEYDADYINYEPEVDEDGDVNSSNVDVGSGFTPENVSAPQSGDYSGELRDNMYIIPFYDSNNQSQFFDPSGPFSGTTFTGSTVTSPFGFWSNAQSNSFSTQVGSGETYLTPRTIGSVVQNAYESTRTFNAGEFSQLTAPQGSQIDDGCILLNGDGSANDTNNTQDAQPLQPGTTLNFGFDWHLPYETGNECQGDSMKVDLGFVFSQVRGSAGPTMQNTFAPANQNPSTSTN